MTVTNDTTSTTTTHNADFTGPLDFEALYLAEKAEKEALQGVNAAIRSQAGASNPTFNQKPPISPEQFKASVGPVAFLNMSRDAKLRGMGCADPSAISNDGLYALFGLGNNGQLAQDLAKQNMGKYRQLKAYAEVLGIYGARQN